MIRRSPLLFLFVLTALNGCSEGSSSSVSDHGLAPDSRAPDSRTTDAAKPDGASPTDVGVTQADSAIANDGGSPADLVPGDTLHVDAPLGPPPAGDTCASAQALTFTSGVAVASGATTTATNALTLASGCVKSSPSSSLSFTTPGKDVFFSVSLLGGQTYTFELDCASTAPKLANCALYLFTNCADPNGTCKAGAVADSVVWPTVTLTLTPTTSGTYYVGVDAIGSQAGAFTLTIK